MGLGKQAVKDVLLYNYFQTLLLGKDYENPMNVTETLDF